MKSRSTRFPPPPRTLSAPAREQWKKYVALYDLDDEHALFQLRIALESWDRVLQCQKTLATEGMFYTDQRGNRRAHPALITERHAQTTMLFALKGLRIDVLPQQKPGRTARRT